MPSLDVIMLRVLLFGLMMLLHHQVFAEPDFSIPPITPEMNALYQVKQTDLTFEGKNYRLFIGEPKSTPVPSAVLCTTDGNAQFPLAINAVAADKPLPLIVGIGYVSDKAYALAERTRDYTFAAEGEEFAKGGGAADFLRFFTQRVKPYIAEKYTLQQPPQETFFGHSFGALFGLYVLLQQGDLFNNYCLASPSLWWGHGALLPTQKPWLQHSPQRILLTLGEYEAEPEKDPTMNPEQLAKIKMRREMMPLDARGLAKELQAQGQAAEFLLIPQKNHGGSIANALQACMAIVQP